MKEGKHSPASCRAKGMFGRDCPNCDNSMKTAFIPPSLIDNQPVTVRVQLPAAWLARAFADWVEQHSEEFAEHMLANDGVRLELASAAERIDNGEIAIVFSRS